MKFSLKLKFNLAQTALGFMLLTMVREEYIWYAVPIIVVLNLLNYIEGREEQFQSLEKKKMTLSELINKQDNKCHYCNCEMHSDIKHPHRATTEHLIDKWSSPNHNKIESESNLVAACWQCNNSRGSIRNKIARSYYKGMASKKNVKLNIPSTPSKQLYSMFGPVPQHLFM